MHIPDFHVDSILLRRKLQFATIYYVLWYVLLMSDNIAIAVLRSGERLKVESKNRFDSQPTYCQTLSRPISAW